MLWISVTIAHGNIRQQTPMYFIRRYRLILAFLRASDSFLKNLQGEDQPFKILLSHTKHTMKKKARE
jgi:hypothetical protein